MSSPLSFGVKHSFIRFAVGLSGMVGHVSRQVSDKTKRNCGGMQQHVQYSLHWVAAQAL